MTKEKCIEMLKAVKCMLHVESVRDALSMAIDIVQDVSGINARGCEGCAYDDADHDCETMPCKICKNNFVNHYTAFKEAQHE